MNIIDEYKDIMERIAVVKSQLTTAKRELDREIMSGGPRDINGISYEQERVQASINQKEAFESLNNAKILTRRIKILEEDMKALFDQCNELEGVINSLGDIKKQIAMYQTRNMPVRQIADKVYLSRRRVYEYIQEINKEKSAQNRTKSMLI